MNEDREVTVTVTPEDMEFRARAKAAGLPDILISMYGTALRKMIADEQRHEIMRRQSEGMRAMSQEEMTRRRLEAEAGARNVYPELTSWQIAQASRNSWCQCRGEVDTPPIKASIKETLWARIRAVWQK